MSKKKVTSDVDASFASAAPRVPNSTIPVFRALLQAYRYARDVGADLWEFAVEIQDFRDNGVSTTDLRWLVHQDYVAHAEETSLHGDSVRSYSPAYGLIFHENTVFVLTELGAAVAEKVVQLPEPSTAPSGSELAKVRVTSYASSRPVKIESVADTRVQGPIVAHEPCVPTWDHRNSELRVDQLLVKRYRVPASSQETILSAFQEEGWPSRIDDPLPKSPEIVPQRRLQYAINGLNRNQKNELLRFHGNGTGDGVSWELIVASINLGCLCGRAVVSQDP